MGDLSPAHRQHLSFRLYRLLLFCYPPAFRRACMDEMLHTFRDCYREALQLQGRWGLLRLWQWLLRDLAITVSVEYVRACIKWLKQLFALEERQVQFFMNITYAQQTDIGRQRDVNEDSMLSRQWFRKSHIMNMLNPDHLEDTL